MLNNIVKLPDGKVYVVAYKFDSESKKPMNAFMAFDFDARELVESVSLSDNMWYFAEGIGDVDFCYTNHNDSGMKNLTTGVTTRLADWEEYGLSARITAFAALPAGELLVGARRGTNMIWGGDSISSMFFGNSEAELWALSPQEETEPNEGRTTIRLACFGAFPYQAQVRLFNRDNPDYQIEVTEYEAGVDPVTFQISRDAITQFNAVVVSGSAPDIVFAPGTVSMDDYAANGLFADLFPSIDGDAEISRGAFIPAVLDAYAVNGALYQLPLSFNVITVAAPKANIGGQTSWTLDEATELERASGKPILPNKTSREILDFMLKQNISRFMNRDDGTCSFDSPEFIKLLEYCAGYPNELRGAVAQTGGEQVRNGLAIAEVVALGSFFDYAAHRLEYGGDITYIGYPSEAGTGSAFQSTHTVSITAKSANKDGAWAFLRLLFAEDFQADNVNSTFPSFPVNIAVFNSLASAATERVLSDNGAELPKTSVYIGGENIDVPALSAEEAQTVIALIASIDTVAREDYALFDIIREEAAVYFAGQRQAADAAALIQGRAAIYASERG
jgi:ABC-type glycerol-3-phosphate transport system substrate-binding protein